MPRKTRSQLSQSVTAETKIKMKKVPLTSQDKSGTIEGQFKKQNLAASIKLKSPRIEITKQDKVAAMKSKTNLESSRKVQQNSSTSFKNDKQTFYKKSSPVNQTRKKVQSLMKVEEKLSSIVTQVRC